MSKRHQWQNRGTLSSDASTTRWHCPLCGVEWWRRGDPEESACPASEGWRAGLVYPVKAWWNDNRPVSCRLVSVSADHATVQPLEGSPHQRFVRRQVVLGAPRGDE